MLNNHGNFLSALTVLSFADAVQGEGPTNVGQTRGQRTFKVDASKMQFGGKIRSDENKAEGSKLDPLPPNHFSIETIDEGEFAGAVKCTSIVYGWPQVKDKEVTFGKNVGKIVKQLSLATTRTGVPVMTEGEDGARERLYINVPYIDDDGNEVIGSFAATATTHFYAKEASQVTTRQESAAAKAGAVAPLAAQRAQPGRQERAA